MCLTSGGAVWKYAFCPTDFFSFFSWGVIRRISPQRVRASRLPVEGWRVVVGRNCLDFAPGVGQNCPQVRRYSSGPYDGLIVLASGKHPMHRNSKCWNVGLGNHPQGPGIRSTGRASGTQRNSPNVAARCRFARETDQLRKIPPTYFCATDAIWTQAYQCAGRRAVVARSVA